MEGSDSVCNLRLDFSWFFPTQVDLTLVSIANNFTQENVLYRCANRVDHGYVDGVNRVYKPKENICNKITKKKKRKKKKKLPRKDQEAGVK